MHMFAMIERYVIVRFDKKKTLHTHTHTKDKCIQAFSLSRSQLLKKTTTAALKHPDRP